MGHTAHAGGGWAPDTQNSQAFLIVLHSSISISDKRYVSHAVFFNFYLLSLATLLLKQGAECARPPGRVRSCGQPTPGPSAQEPPPHSPGPPVSPGDGTSPRNSSETPQAFFTRGPTFGASLTLPRNNRQCGTGKLLASSSATHLWAGLESFWLQVQRRICGLGEAPSGRGSHRACLWPPPWDGTRPIGLLSLFLLWEARDLRWVSRTHVQGCVVSSGPSLPPALCLLFQKGSVHRRNVCTRTHTHSHAHTRGLLGVCSPHTLCAHSGWHVGPVSSGGFERPRAPVPPNALPVRSRRLWGGVSNVWSQCSEEPAKGFLSANPWNCWVRKDYLRCGPTACREGSRHRLSRQPG